MAIRKMAISRRGYDRHVRRYRSGNSGSSGSDSPQLPRKTDKAGNDRKKFSLAECMLVLYRLVFPNNWGKIWFLFDERPVVFFIRFYKIYLRWLNDWTVCKMNFHASMRLWELKLWRTKDRVVECRGNWMLT